MQRILSFLSGFIIGGAIGATIALLLTPSSGEDLRMQIQERTRQVQMEVREAAAARRAELEEQLASLRAPRKSSG
jgi:gas vesicle protein